MLFRNMGINLKLMNSFLKVSLYLLFVLTLIKCSSDDGNNPDPCTELEWFRDVDGDGFGDPTDSTFDCEQPAGFVANNTDCDDNDSRFTTVCTCEAASLCGDYPNCTDELTWFQDADEDGLGNPNVSTTACEQPDGFVANQDDDFDGGTIWAGERITFTRAADVDHTQEANQDRMTDNVSLTRADRRGLFNIQQEASFNNSSSPADTEWAFGTTADIANLNFTNWRASHNNNAPSIVGQDMVVHLITDNIYVDIKFTEWAAGDAGGGAFAYERTTP